MKPFSFLAIFFLIFSLSCKNETAPVVKKAPEIFQLPSSTPELQGIASDTISKLLKNIEASGQEFHSLIILRHGHIIAETYWNPYSADDKQQTYSLSKSFTSSAIGFAVDEGLLSVEDPIIKFFPEDAPDTISDNLAALKVKHLLSMSVGHAKDAIRILEATQKGQTWASTFLSLPVVFEPGSQFMYNSGASYMLASIVRKVTGKSAHEYITPKLYEPLSITNVTWTENDEGNNMGASHIRLPTLDIAKFGQLYLQKGKWNDEQIISKEWVEQATTKRINNGDNDSSWSYGYGYQFWMNPPGGFRADGAFGQFSMVLPEQDLVVAMTTESMSTAATMQLIWDFVEKITNESPLPENKIAYENLQANLQALKYDPPKLNTTSTLSDIITGKEFILEDNPFDAMTISFDIEKDNIFFTLRTKNKADIVVNCGINKWVRASNNKPEAHSLFSLRRIDFDSKIAASATWQDDNTLILTTRYMETTHGDQFIFTFNDGTVNIKFNHSLARLRDQEDGRAEINGRLDK